MDKNRLYRLVLDAVKDPLILVRPNGAVVLTNSDRGHEFADAVIRVIGEREGWPGF